MINKDAIEAALSAGHLWAQMRNGRWWKLRRNGATKLWKTRPTEFRIPVKAGLKSCGYLTQSSNIGVGNPQDRPDFVVSERDPNEKIKVEVTL